MTPKLASRFRIVRPAGPFGITIGLALSLLLPTSAKAGDGSASGSVKLDSGKLSAEGDANGAGGKHRLRLEGGLGILVGPASDRFRTLGGGGAVAYEFRPIRYLGIEPRYTLYGFRIENSAVGNEGSGFAHMAGAHLRAYPMPDLKVGQLWLGAGPEMVFTARGADNIRPGVSAGAGFEFNAHWAVAVGPFVRYSHVFQPDDDVAGPQDAQFLQTGLSIAFGGKRPSDDRDGDGIKNGDDQCVDVPEDIDGFQDDDGCPEADNDNDGIADTRDACPMEPGPANDDPALNGCPADSSGDRDTDGIPDASDACPDQPEDMDGSNDDDGCPDLDDDQDGILDPNDQCPTEPETVNGISDEDGCPDTAPSKAVVKVLQEVGARVYFETNSYEIDADGKSGLRDLANTLQANPNITVLRVEAHADAQGSESANQTLSERRAEAVRNELIRLGVDPSRVEARGYGEKKLEVESAAAERQNRRAVFRVMSVN